MLKKKSALDRSFDTEFDLDETLSAPVKKRNTKRKNNTSAKAANEKKSSSSESTKADSVSPEKPPVELKSNTPNPTLPVPDSSSSPKANLDILSQLRAAAVSKSSPAPRKQTLLTTLEEKLNQAQLEQASSSPPAPSKQPIPTPSEQPSSESAAHAPTSPNQDKNIQIKPPIIVKDLALALGLKPFQLVHHLMELSIFATLTQAIEEEVAKKVCTKLGYTLNVEKRDKQAAQQQAAITAAKPAVEGKPSSKKAPQENRTSLSDIRPRPPVITFMGHVDHGKTSLLDAIRKTKVAATEAGGITQHIGAYTIEHNGHPITFLDTPGHEAFTAMRARGAHITDIAIIVVAADDGLMPQTIEAISHAKAAKVPIIVAINKIDLPGANLLKIKSQLQEKGLVPEEYGGDTIVCEVSATKRIGIDHLLEMMLLQAEILELKSDYSAPATGRVIESQVEQGRGPTATVIVQSGTLKVGDNIVCGLYYGRVKALINDRGQNIKSASPGMPVRILGLTGVPTPGEGFEVKKDEREARLISEQKQEELRMSKLDKAPQVTLENIFDAMNGNQKKTLRILIKCDVQGSLEAIEYQLKNIKSKKVDLEIVHSAIGPVTETDIMLAKASNGIVIGFNTKTEPNAINAAKRESVQIKLYSIIYELVDQIKEAMSGLLDPELRESTLGTAIVKKVFILSKYPVAGCVVQSGRIVRNAHARVLRKKQPVYDGNVATLKRFQDDVNEVRAGFECGIRLGNFTEYQEDDIIECYQLEKIPQSL